MPVQIIGAKYVYVLSVESLTLLALVKSMKQLFARLYAFLFAAAVTSRCLYGNETMMTKDVNFISR